MVFMAMLLVAMFAEPLARALRLPFSVLLVVIGFAGSELVVHLGMDTGLRWQQFNYLVLQVFVPVLVFESAFNMNARALLANLPLVLVLAIPAMLLAAAVTGALLYVGIGHPAGFPLLAALLCGAIVSATDPVAVVSLFKQLGAPERLTALLEGESLFNDATAVVVFSLLVALAAVPGEGFAAGRAISAFLYTFTGGILAGLIVGGLAWLLYRTFTEPVSHTVISLVAATTAFYLAEHWLHVSGIVAVLCAGLTLGECHRRAAVPDHFTGEVWELGAYICNALVFLLVGVTITAAMFTSHWLAMLIGIAAATAARAVNIYLLLPLLSRALPGEAPAASYRHVMMWGGLRGAVSLALALSLPTAIEGWYSIQSIAYGIVLFTLFVQAPLMPPLVRRALARAAPDPA